jgi:hypothetical protein
LPGGESDLFDIGGGVPQGSPLLVVLFILYNSELFDICRRLRAGILGVGFADDLIVLAYSTTTRANCIKLEELYKDCLSWAKRHGIKFAPDKYELVHFTRARKRFDLSASVQLGNGIVKEPTKEVRVLGVILDSKL